jgi:hypothetical protein
VRSQKGVVPSNGRGEIRCCVDPPQRFGRASVPLRLLIVVIFFVPATLNWVALLLLLPPFVAVRLAARGGASFEADDADRLCAWLKWTGALYAYVGFLTDRLTLDQAPEVVAFDLVEWPNRSPASALAREVTSIPSALLFAVLAVASLVVWLLAAVMVLTTTAYPRGLQRFQRRVLCYETWLLAYAASLVSRYPRFAALA